jgi:hypothetical protein
MNSEWLKQSGDDTEPDDDDSDEGEGLAKGGRAGAKKKAAAKKVAAKKKAEPKKPKLQFWAFGEDSTHHILAIDMDTGAILTIDQSDPSKIEMAGNSFTHFIDNLTDKKPEGNDDEPDDEDLAGLYEGDDDDDTKSQGSATGGDGSDDDLLDKLKAQGVLSGGMGGGSGSDTDDEPYGYQCDGCRVEIKGIRFSCDVCDNFDLW